MTDSRGVKRKREEEEGQLIGGNDQGGSSIWEEFERDTLLAGVSEEAVLNYTMPTYSPTVSPTSHLTPLPYLQASPMQLYPQASPMPLYPQSYPMPLYAYPMPSPSPYQMLPLPLYMPVIAQVSLEINGKNERQSPQNFLEKKKSSMDEDAKIRVRNLRKREDTEAKKIARDFRAKLEAYAKNQETILSAVIQGPFKIADSLGDVSIGSDLRNVIEKLRELFDNCGMDELIANLNGSNGNLKILFKDYDFNEKTIIAFYSLSPQQQTIFLAFFTIYSPLDMITTLHPESQALEFGRPIDLRILENVFSSSSSLMLSSLFDASETASTSNPKKKYSQVASESESERERVTKKAKVAKVPKKTNRTKKKPPQNRGCDIHRETPEEIRELQLEAENFIAKQDGRAKKEAAEKAKDKGKLQEKPALVAPSASAMLYEQNGAFLPAFSMFSLGRSVDLPSGMPPVFPELTQRMSDQGW